MQLLILMGLLILILILRGMERKISQNRNMSLNQPIRGKRQAKAWGHHTPGGGHLSLRASCLSALGSLQTSICPFLQHYAELPVRYRQALPSSLCSFPSSSLTSCWGMGSCSPLKAFRAPDSREGDTVALAQAAPTIWRYKVPLPHPIGLCRSSGHPSSQTQSTTGVRRCMKIKVNYELRKFGF